LSVTFNATLYDDWRLPTAGDTPVYGYNQSGPDNELEHLYYDEGSGGIPAEFSNITSDYYYWSGTDYAPNPAYAWGLKFTNGLQNTVNKNDSYLALAVRPGDVSGSAVPELPTGAMQLMVMMMAAGYIRSRKAGFSRYHKNV
ncbi:MAG: DUF1566 domain-containing protein, partial [Candidatus Omnitrophica bacterium]|nr:DUF1566 domain-containing protein [Candidatus Omnitrophota bacterium]